MPTISAESEKACSMAVLARGGQLQILNFCSRISELLWVLLWPRLRSSFNREMAGDRMVRWRSGHESVMNPGFVGRNCKVILNSKKSGFSLSFLCFIHFICLNGVGKICHMGNQVCCLSCLSGHIKHHIQYINHCTSEYALWCFWQNLYYMDWLLKVTKHLKLN